MASSSKEGTKHTHSLRDFKGVNTQAARQSIGDDEFSWLENVVPIGFGNLQAVAGPSGILASWAPDTAYYFTTANLFGVDYTFVFCSNGAAYQINSVTYSVNKFAVAGTFSGYGTAMCQWQNSAICIVDPTKGYFTYDGTTLNALLNTVQNITVANPGNGYTLVPAITISPPISGTTATATVDLVMVGATLVDAGTAYQVGDILSSIGGVTGNLGTVAQFTVTTVSSGVITGFNITNSGDYTTVPTNPIYLSGGYGSGATVNAHWGLGNPTLTNAGSGYTTAPTVTIGVAVTGASCTAATVVLTNPDTGQNYVGGIYTVNDLLTVVGGTSSVATVLKVTSVGTIYLMSGGHNQPFTVITGVSVQTAGSYSVLPTNPVAVTGGTGTNAHFNLSFTGTGTNYNQGNLLANLSVSPPSGTAIASYSGRIWVASNRTISFSAPGSNTDFTSINAGGSFVFSDETMHSSIQNLLSANGYLYIFGTTSIDIISGVQIVNGITVFSETNISAAIGSNQIFSVTPFYRSVAFATEYGFYSLSGTTTQKISDHLDGVFPLINLSIPISSGSILVNNVICLAFMFQYLDPVLGARGLIAVLFNKKWLFISQGNNLVLMATSLATGGPTMLATDGMNLYSLLSNPTSDILQTVETKLWDMGDPVRDKQILKVGIETITTNLANGIVGTVDTEISGVFANFTAIQGNIVNWINSFSQIVSWQNNSLQTVLWSAPGYQFNKLDVQTTGKYVGVSLTGYAPEQVYSAIHLQYELRAIWTTLPV